MKCPFCGEENISGADSCESCGEDLTAFDGVRPRDVFEKRMVKTNLQAIAHCEPLMITPSTPIKEVTQGLTPENRCGLVMDGRRLVGVVTVRDILQKVLFKNLDLETTPVEKIMTARPDVLKAEDKIVHALNKMAMGGYRHIPIFKADKTYTVISVRDILAFLAEMFPDVAGMRE